MAEKYNNGTFFVNPAQSKDRDTSPDYFGTGRIPIAVLDDMIAYNNEHPAMEYVPMNCAGWKKSNTYGNYVSLSVSVETRPLDSNGKVIKERQSSNEQTDDPDGGFKL